MEIKTWLAGAKKQVDALDAELIALRAFAPKTADRSWLATHDVIKITTKMQEKADEMVNKRASGVPLAYILGEKEFYGRRFEVNPDVLIPRSETEMLIDLVKELPLSKRPRFLDVGTGSGCIAITLALEYPQSYVLATDVSIKALDVAQGNDVRFEGRVELMESNLLRDIDFWAPDTVRAEKFDVLVANLPYVDKGWDWIDKDMLDFEPARALYAGAKGLSMYRRLFREIQNVELLGRAEFEYVAVEADPCQHQELVGIAERRGFFKRKIQGYALLFETVRNYRFWPGIGFVHKTQKVTAEGISPRLP